MTRVFISYAYESSAFVDRLGAAVSAIGRQVVTFDRWDHPMALDVDVVSAVRSCDFFVSVLMPPSPGALYELGVAVGARKPVLLVLGADQGLPLDVRELPCIFVRGDERGVDDVARAVEAMSPVGKAATPFHGTAREFLLRCADDDGFLDSLPPGELEAAVERWFDESGAEVTRIDAELDAGADFFVHFRDGRRVAVEVKKRSPQSRLSVDHVRALIGTVAMSRAHEAWLIATCEFTASAKSMAAEAPMPVRLLTLRELAAQ